MSRTRSTNIVNVGYRSTNYWVLGNGDSRLLVDIGWPGTMPAMIASLKRKSVSIDQIKFALATHYHIDHAGLAEEIKAHGVTLLVIDVQVDSIAKMKRWTKPADHYVEITNSGNHVISCSESRQLIQQIGIDGQIVFTPGHSDHCVSLVLDDGSAFTGDLQPHEYCFDNTTALASWSTLRSHGARMIYPAHGGIRPLSPSPSPITKDIGETI
jgi:endoribonuclease LACTB2